MKYIIVIISVIVMIFSSCTTKESTKQEVKVKLNNDKKNNNIVDDNLYEIILEKDSTNNLIVFIDPHGDATFVAEKIKNITKNINSNIICLRNVKNNTANYTSIIKNDIENYKQKLKKKIDNLYFIGFSGGARMAFAYSVENKISGLVMCGAGIGNMIKNSYDFPIVFIAGLSDFNFNEQYYSPFSEIAKNKNILGLSFNGKHEWPNNKLLLLSINFLMSKINNNDNYTMLFNDYNEYKKQNKMYLAFKQIEAINKIFNTKETNIEFNKFISSTNFVNFITNFEILLQIEYDRNNSLVNNLQKQNWEWWSSKIDEINNIINTSNDKQERNSYNRTKSYLGVVMYSVVSKEVNNLESDYIEKYLKIYEKLEPENADMKQFKNYYMYR